MTDWRAQHQTSNPRAKQDIDAEGLCHLLRLRDYKEAAKRLSLTDDSLVGSRRFDVLEPYIKDLPDSILEGFPMLMIAEGNVCRLTCRFDEALTWYVKAKGAFARQLDKQGISRALRGQAMVYLDTIQPAKAEALLTSALKASRGNPQERALTLRLLAENKTNQGRPIVAETLLKTAERIVGRPEVDQDVIELRMLLRSGRLEKARSLAETIVAGERGANQEEQVSHSYREAALILSLVYSWKGEPDKARQCAEDSLILGQRLNSPFIEVAAYMRLGHACQVSADVAVEDIANCYHTALDLCDVLDVRTGRSEALMGLCLLYGFNNDMSAAERYGREALVIAQQAGDEWMAGLCMLNLGIALANTGHEDRAMTILSQAASTFAICGDSYNLVITRFWLALSAIHQGRTGEFSVHATALFKMAQMQDYDFLFSRKTLFGPRDPGAAISILMEARRQGIEKDYVTYLLDDMNLLEAASCTSNPLRIQALGPLRVWREEHEIKDVRWKRSKARTLFGLLITCRRELLRKEQIMDMLYPGMSADVAYRNFRVTLNALNVSLQPERGSYALPLYVLRHEQCYGLNLASGYWLDVEEFESLIGKANSLKHRDESKAIELYRQAVELYKGDYLQDLVYEDWSGKERQRLFELYEQAVHGLAGLLALKEDYEGCIELCRRLLAKDNCWEEGYRLLMLCHYKLGNRPRALRVYRDCVECLREGLDVLPMPSTVHLYDQIRERAL
jgi:LuxR family maltose regulon positive regulatory protein